MEATKLFSVFTDAGTSALEALRKRAITPETKKTLRTWGITSAAEMIGVGVTTLRDAEKLGKVPMPPLDEDSQRRVYTLKHINTLREFYGTRPSKPKDKLAKVVACTNFKGGVAKTTSAVNLAQKLALNGYKVCLIDLDSQGSATHSFGYIPDIDISENETLLPFFRGEITSIVSLVKETYWDSLSLIPANLSLYNTEFELPVKHMLSKQKSGDDQFLFYALLSQALQTISPLFDVIVLDTPPSMGMISMNAAYAADGLVIPTPPSMMDIASTVQFFSMLTDVFRRLPKKEFDFVALAISKFEKSTTSVELEKIIRAVFGKYVLSTNMPMSEAIKKAGTELCSVYEIEHYQGSKKTLDRIISAIDDMNEEIIQLIIQSWSGEKTSVDTTFMGGVNYE